jgi:hypothetical protein
LQYSGAIASKRASQDGAQQEAVMKTFNRTGAWVCVIAGGAVIGAALAWPSAAAPAPLRPAFTAVICTAKPPRFDHAFANAIRVVPAGSVIRVADAGISQADHAEVMFKLGLLQGHLMIGRALIEAGQQTLALPHFGHPVRELYDDISGDMTKRGLSQFDGELIALEALAAGKPGDPAMLAQYDKVLRIMDAVRATVPSELRDNVPFMTGVLGEVSVVAGEDYNESVEDGRITKPVEYHDSRGYLLYAAQELTRLEGRPELKSDARLAAARAGITELQGIVAPLLPPEVPIRTVAQFKAAVARYKAAVAAPPAASTPKA